MYRSRRVLSPGGFRPRVMRFPSCISRERSRSMLGLLQLGCGVPMFHSYSSCKRVPCVGTYGRCTCGPVSCSGYGCSALILYGQGMSPLVCLVGCCMGGVFE